MENRKRYLKVFDTQSEYNQNKHMLGEPYVVFLEDIKDVTCTAREIAFSTGTTTGVTTGVTTGATTAMTNGYEYVDLGLPSGIKWAKYNVGATDTPDYGLFFQWGDPQGHDVVPLSGGGFYCETKDYFNFDEYSLGTGTSSYIKYNTGDGLTRLELVDDGVHANMGGNWRMPTGTNFEELVANTFVMGTSYDNVRGLEFTNKSDSTKKIFLPWATVENGSFTILGTGYYFTSDLPSSAYLICNGSANVFTEDKEIDNRYRYNGTPLRGVIEF